MKKTICFCLIFSFMIGILQIAAFAIGDGSVTSPNHEITVYVPDDVEEQIKEKIYAMFYGLEMPGDNQDNILCTLFGHKLTETSATVITHNVYSNSPRCLKEIYDIAACSRCDYTSQTLVASVRIYCH